MNILSMLGLMKVEDHERLTRQKTAALDTIAQSYCTEVKAGTDWEAKFKAAASDLAAQAEEIERLTARGDEWRAIAEGFRTDAQLWRNARDKRSQGRGASSDAAPKAKKGAAK